MHWQHPMLIPAFALSAPVVAYLHVGPVSQTAFKLDETRFRPSFDSESDPAAQPNIRTHFEITSNGSSGLYCARPDDEFNAGYAHFTNSDGVEDKHMFWWFVDAFNFIHFSSHVLLGE
jgi:hypothetical protein